MKTTILSPARCFIALLAILAPVAVGMLAAPASRAQVTASDASPHLEFETALVQLHPMTPGTYLIKNFAHAPPFVIPTSNAFTDTAHAQDLIMEAYGLSDYQILYLPWWALSQRGTVFDIEAKAKGEGTPTPAQLQQMLQSLLADQFHLKTHWETNPKFAVYALIPDKGAPKFHEFHKDDSKAATFNGTTIFALARFLTQNLDLPVVDRTGLPGVLYDFDIDKLVSYHEIDREQEADPAQAEQYLREAVLHQLGLKLDSRKESTQFLVVDHIDEPSRN